MFRVNLTDEQLKLANKMFSSLNNTCEENTSTVALTSSEVSMLKRESDTSINVLGDARGDSRDA